MRLLTRLAVSVAVLCTLLGVRPAGQTGASAALEPWEDVSIAGRNAEPMHATLVPFDLKKRDLVTLNVDLAQMGVGGDTSWGAKTHPEYTVPARPYSYRFRLRPFAARETPPEVLAKQVF